MNTQTSLGRHIIAELYQCDVSKINDVTYVEKSMLTAADKSGATVINSTFHHFSPFGVSGVIVIQESHFSIHCWPEFAYASIDIFTCGDTVNPWVAYEYLLEAFGASHGSTVELNRGQSNLIGHQRAVTGSLHETKSTWKNDIKYTRNVWFTQRNEHIALSLKHSGERLLLEHSPYQKIEIYQTEAFGKILVLDDKIVCAEEDEYVYHEMIAHVPVFSHPNPKNILVIGGGDGGTVRELVKHSRIQTIDLIEIDAQVLAASKEHLPELASALDHEKVNLKILDGITYVANCKPASYDLVIIDSDEPEGPGAGLFTEGFYKDVYRILRDNGILVTQSESPRYNREIFKDVFHKYHCIFGIPNVHCYLMYLPSFPSGMWSFSFSVKGEISPTPLYPEEIITSFCEENLLKYYSFEVHKSAFVLPKFVKDIIA